jgi:hypothetical protein
MSDGITGTFTEVIKNPYAITSTFDTIKNIFNELMFFLYLIYFFIVFLLFVFLVYMLFMYLPFKLIKTLTSNKTILRRLIRFDLSLFRIDISKDGATVNKSKVKAK